MVNKVAPFTGAWIEIGNSNDLVLCVNASHPSRVRGLKFRQPSVPGHRYTSHPSRVRGLKFFPVSNPPDFQARRTLHGCVD